MTVSGLNAGDFSVTTAPSGTVSGAGTTTFIVTFDPSGAGARDAVINITSNDADEATYNFAVRGSGALPSTGTTLGAGDIAFVGYNSDTDGFGFALLKAVAKLYQPAFFLFQHVAE